jgi:hypothetical protein
MPRSGIVIASVAKQSPELNRHCERSEAIPRSEIVIASAAKQSSDGKTGMRRLPRRYAPRNDRGLTGPPSPAPPRHCERSEAIPRSEIVI